MASVLIFLQTEMECPIPWGWFHFMWIFIGASVLISLVVNKNRSDSKQRWVLFIYGFVALILELSKQFIWTYTYNQTTGDIIQDYQWYAAPFQFCSTPMYIALICSALKPSVIRNVLLSYLSYFTILGGFMTMIIPNSCFTSDILVNIHTMWLHCGSLVISCYLLISQAVKPKLHNYINGLMVFVSLTLTALVINIGVYQSGILNGETFNMFYISPYFVSDLPVFNIIQANVPYFIFLLSYILAIGLGAFIVYSITNLIVKFSFTCSYLQKNKIFK